MAAESYTCELGPKSESRNRQGVGYTWNQASWHIGVSKTQPKNSEIPIIFAEKIRYISANRHKPFTIESNFSAPLRYGDVASVDLTLKKIGRSSASLSYKIHRQQDSVLCFSACITLVFMDLDQHKVLPIPDNIRNLFATIAWRSWTNRNTFNCNWL